MKQANGFTLVELLVAMVAGSLLLASLTWMLGSVTRIFKAQPADLVIRQVGDLAPILSRLIAQIPPPDQDIAPMDVSAEAMTFMSTPPQALAADGLMKVTLKTERRTDGLALVGQFDGMRKGQTWSRSDTLAHGFSAIAFEARWPNEPGAPRLPSLLSLRFATPDGRTARIVAAPRLNGGGTCRFDPISMTCRH